MKGRAQSSIETHNCYVLDRNNRALICNDNSDDILILLHQKQVFYVNVNPTCSHVLQGVSLLVLF